MGIWEFISLATICSVWVACSVLPFFQDPFLDIWGKVRDTSDGRSAYTDDRKAVSKDAHRESQAPYDRSA